MEPQKLKKEFGQTCDFLGGWMYPAFYQAFHQKKSETIVRQQKEILKKGDGGFVFFNQVHNILPQVPPENIIAMFEAM